MNGREEWEEKEERESSKDWNRRQYRRKKAKRERDYAGNYPKRNKRTYDEDCPDYDDEEYSDYDD